MLFDKTLETLSRSLDLHLDRHSIIADNIANSATPGYRARKVEFEAELQRAVAQIEQGNTDIDLDRVSGRVVENPDSPTKPDLNTVDMDREMAALNRNDATYAAATQILNKKFALLKYAITEGGDK